MEKFKYVQKIKEIYAQGGNIIQYLRNLNKTNSNSIEDILISYDFQSGSYIKQLSANPEFKNNYCYSLSQIINSLKPYKSIIEIGIGEATTLVSLLKFLHESPTDIMGFDISWSRLKFAKRLLEDYNYPNVRLFTANLFEIPLPDNSIDIVYTSHSIEPNGGNEEEALKELFRITKNYLVLLEPSYEFASDEARDRMRLHGYVTNLYRTAKNLGYKVIDHRLFDFSINPLNPTGLLIIEKNSNQSNDTNLICPISHTKLAYYTESLLYSEESHLAYPIIDGIPCLLKENSILTTHLLTDYEQFKQDHKIHFQ